MLSKFRTYQHAVSFYRATRQLKLPGHLKDQLERAAASVVLNLAEVASGKAWKGVKACSSDTCQSLC